jgi:hypothetical protein
MQLTHIHAAAHIPWHSDAAPKVCVMWMRTCICLHRQDLKYCAQSLCFAYAHMSACTYQSPLHSFTNQDKYLCMPISKIILNSNQPRNPWVLERACMHMHRKIYAFSVAKQYFFLCVCTWACMVHYVCACVRSSLAKHLRLCICARIHGWSMHLSTAKSTLRLCAHADERCIDDLCIHPCVTKCISLAYMHICRFWKSIRAFVFIMIRAWGLCTHSHQHVIHNLCAHPCATNCTHLSYASASR